MSVWQGSIEIIDGISLDYEQGGASAIDHSPQLHRAGDDQVQLVGAVSRRHDLDALLEELEAAAGQQGVLSVGRLVN